MNLPNKITIFRILLIPLFLIVLLWRPGGEPFFPGQVFVAVGIFIFAAATDGIDGYIARKYNLVTNLGKFLDPLADKLLVSAALIALVELGQAEAWVVWVILAREFAVTGLRAIAASDGAVISASYLGKIKTVTQMAAIVVLLLNNYPFALWGIYPGQPLLYLALLFTLVSGIDYLYKGRASLRN